MKKKVDEQQQKDPVSQAVRDLRTALGESQQAFAYRTKTAIRTIARYETVRPPKGKALAEFQKLAAETGHQKLATVFSEAYMEEMGPAKTMMALGTLSYVLLPRIRAELAQVASDLRKQNVTPEARIEGAVLKLDSITSMIVKKYRPYFPKPEGAEKGKESE
jgi:hypothetical protein